MDIQGNPLQKSRILYTKAEYILNGILLAVSMLFYLLFPLCDGPVWCVDSGSYAAMDISREPLYPIFLAITRKCLGNEQSSLMAVVILQSLLAGFVTWYAGITIKRLKNQSIMLQVVTMGFQFAVSLICRFTAVRGSVYIDCIMTEGLGLSLFALFILELYLYINTDKKRYLAGTLLLSYRIAFRSFAHF